MTTPRERGCRHSNIKLRARRSPSDHPAFAQLSRRMRDPGTGGAPLAEVVRRAPAPRPGPAFRRGRAGRSCEAAAVPFARPHRAVVALLVVSLAACSGGGSAEPPRELGGDRPVTL